MRSAMILASLVLPAVGVAGCDGEPAGDVGQLEQAAYVPCFPPGTDFNAVCRGFHPEGKNVIATSYCQSEDCFELNYGEQVTVRLPDDDGEFPGSLFVWHDAGLEMDNSLPGFPCVLTEKTGLTILHLPDDSTVPKCKAELRIGKYLYHEHFVSNSSKRCLAWGECRENAP